MPQTLFQKVFFTLLTVLVSVCVFVVYNLAVAAGGLTNQIFLSSWPEILIEFPVAFVLQFFVCGPLSLKLAFRVVDPRTDRPRHVVLAITFMTIALMCPAMSLASTVLHHGFGPELVAQGLQAMALNFPLAVFSQFFFIGPFVRLTFRTLFRVRPAQPAV